MRQSIRMMRFHRTHLFFCESCKMVCDESYCPECGEDLKNKTITYYKNP